MLGKGKELFCLCMLATCASLCALATSRLATLRLVASHSRIAPSPLPETMWEPVEKGEEAGLP